MHIQKIINDNVDASTFVGIDTETVVPLRGGKSNPHQGRVTKRVTGSNVMIFCNNKSNAYENMVRRRLAAEGKDPTLFMLQPRKWGQRIPNTPFIEHNDSLYMEVIFLRSGQVEYLLDGQPVSEDAIFGLTEKQESHQGGLDKKVIIRTYAVESIRCIRINKEVHSFV